MSATHSQPRIRSNAMIALEVRDLIVEVGGKIVVEDRSAWAVATAPARRAR